MSQIERREVIRDDYGSKHYEIIYKAGAMFVYDYALQGFLIGEEGIEVLKAIEELRRRNEHK